MKKMMAICCVLALALTLISPSLARAEWERWAIPLAVSASVTTGIVWLTGDKPAEAQESAMDAAWSASRAEKSAMDAAEAAEAAKRARHRGPGSR